MDNEHRDHGQAQEYVGKTELPDSIEYMTRGPSDTDREVDGDGATRQREDEIRRQIEMMGGRLVKGSREEKDVLRAFKEAEKKLKKGPVTMLRELWGKTPADCRLALIGEFLFDPNAFKHRYEEEMKFQSNLQGRWEK